MQRRAFLRAVVGASSLVLLAACSPLAPPAPTTPAKAPAAGSTAASSAAGSSAPASKPASAAGASAASGKLAPLPDGYPNKPITMRVLQPGSATEYNGRLLAQKAEAFSPVPIHVDVAEGNTTQLIGTLVSRPQAKDGYELSPMTDSSITVIYTGQASYKIDDIKSVLTFSKFGVGVAVTSDSPLKSFKEFADAAAAKPGTYRAVLSGPLGGNWHVGVYRLSELIKGDLKIIPSDNSGQGAQTLIGGGADVAISTLLGLAPFVKEGRVRLLAVSGEERSDVFPDVPTIRELGYDFVLINTFRLVVPSTVPDERVQWLSDLISRGIDADAKQKLASQDFPFALETREQAQRSQMESAAQIRASLDKLGLLQEKG